MANVADYKGYQQPFSNQMELIKVVYDFANDAGAQGALSLIKAKSPLVLHKLVAKVKTACTSGGSATVAVAKNGSGAAGMAATAVASLTANAVIAGAPSAGGVYLAADDTLDVLIGTADLTAGKIEFEMLVTKF